MNWTLKKLTFSLDEWRKKQSWTFYAQVEQLNIFLFTNFCKSSREFSSWQRTSHWVKNNVSAVSRAESKQSPVSPLIFVTSSALTAALTWLASSMERQSECWSTVQCRKIENQNKLNKVPELARANFPTTSPLSETIKIALRSFNAVMRQMVIDWNTPVLFLADPKPKPEYSHRNWKWTKSESKVLKDLK